MDGRQNQSDIIHTTVDINNESRFIRLWLGHANCTMKKNKGSPQADVDPHQEEVESISTLNDAI